MDREADFTSAATVMHNVGTVGVSGGCRLNAFKQQICLSDRLLHIVCLLDNRADNSRSRKVTAFSNFLMILPQVHLRKPCYDFCPVQAAAIKMIFTDKQPAKADSQQSSVFSKRLSSGQRRAVCTKGRDVINAS